MITVNSSEEINYNPKNTLEEVVSKEEQPLNRDFAFDSDLIDKNINVVQNRITSHLTKIIREYEPRAVLRQTRIIMKDTYNNDFDIELGIEVINIE